MIFNEAIYPLFLAVTVAVFHLLPGRARPWWLFATGLAFYAYYATAFLWLLAVEIAVVWVAGRMVRRSRAAFAAGLGATIGALAWFKYSGMAVNTAQRVLALLGRGGLPTFESLYLPLALSFFTFEFVHYLIEGRRGALPEHGLGDFLAFAVFFPTMVAGPIKRFPAFLEQLRGARLTPQDAQEGITRILVGAAKKIVLADTLSLWIQLLLSRAGVSGTGRADLLVALLAYGLKIYLDFSGYSDIAIGSARLFGIRVPENFSWPYLRADIASFWRHWHMSLTSWISDYIYRPLGGNRKGLARTVLHTLVAFAVSGLWHGAAWHFVAWGLYHGALLCTYRVWRHVVERTGLRAPERMRPLASLAGGLLTFALVTFGWGLFVMPVGRFGLLLARLAGS
ncbi:MAG: MBOAT family O-acyltransferase [Coriobacteriia bacterium]